MQGIANWSGVAAAAPWVVTALALVLALAGRARCARDRRTIVHVRRRHEALRAAVDGLGDGLAYFDADDRLVAFNQAYARAMQRLTDLPLEGSTFADLVGAAVRDGAAHLSADQRDALIARCMQSHRTAGKAWLHRMRDGRWLRVKAIGMDEIMGERV